MEKPHTLHINPSCVIITWPSDCFCFQGAAAGQGFPFLEYLAKDVVQVEQAVWMLQILEWQMV